MTNMSKDTYKRKLQKKKKPIYQKKPTAYLSSRVDTAFTSVFHFDSEHTSNVRGGQTWVYIYVYIKICIYSSIYIHIFICLYT